MHPFLTWANANWVGRFLDWFILHADWKIGPMMRFVDRVLKTHLEEDQVGGNTEKNDMLQALIFLNPL